MRMGIRVKMGEEARGGYAAVETYEGKNRKDLFRSVQVLLLREVKP